MLLLLVWLVFCVCISNGEYSVRCGIGEGLSFVEATDGVVGRYRLEWCTLLNQSMGRSAQWVVSLRYNTHQKPEDCRQYKSKCSRWEVHSYFMEDVTIDLNCTNVCLSTNFDLIFNGTCYAFKTHLMVKPNSFEVQRFGARDYVHFVTNNYSKESFSESQAVTSIYQSGEHVVAEWYLHHIPATNYTMDLCPEATKECVDVTGNCSAPAPTRLVCALWPRGARYALRLTHRAPWTSGLPLFDNIVSVELPPDKSVLLPNTTAAIVTPAASGSPWWALGVVAAAAVASVAALLACRSHLARKLRQRVYDDWRNRRQTEPATKPEAGAGGGGRVLLLYARDCAPMMEVAARLKALLQAHGQHVHDLYSPETVSAAARAPGEWVRRALTAPDTRVLLLQSPAAAALLPHRLHLAPPPHPCAPLLVRRAVYRRPHGSDALLPLALRLVADGAHAAHAYRKFYVATIEGLEVELVREVTPLRRYPLPAAAALLLRDVTHADVTADDVSAGCDVTALASAVRELQAHVRANPDYLEDELMFFDYD